MRADTYIHQRSDWPRFSWDDASLSSTLADVRHRQGRLLGRMESLGFDLQQEAVLQTLTTDVVTSSAIEGEWLDVEEVRSSVARRLGIDIGGLKSGDRYVDGVVEMMLDATRDYSRVLTAERVCGWQAELFPTGRSGLRRIIVGAWRTDSIDVVSGPIGRERVHFQAPSAQRVEGEMRDFLAWFNGAATIDPVLKAALAHLWFVTIHPFDDGNGRIARAIADMALAQSENSSQRFYSMSAQIRRERKAYYDILELTQSGSLDVTSWLEWFLGCLGRAIDDAQTALASLLAKARFWEMAHGATLNDRQVLVLNLLLDGPSDVLTTPKYAKVARCSADTALRDIQALVERGLLTRNSGGGRSTAYTLVRK